MTLSPTPESLAADKSFTAVVALKCAQPFVREGETSQCAYFVGDPIVGRIRHYCRYAMCCARWSNNEAYFLCGNAIAQGIAPTKE